MENGKLVPRTEQHSESTRALNLTVLQRTDPFVSEILLTAAHVTLYRFDLELHQWSRKDVEGSLFVVKRNTQPRFQFVVMNRRNTDNLVEDLLGDFEFDVQFPYLLYRNAAQEVNGIWFYTEDDCTAVANLFNRILNAYSKVPMKPKVSSIATEFEDLEAAQNSVVVESPIEPPASTTTVNPDVPDDSFVNFFAGTKFLGTTPKAITEPPLQSSASTAVPSYTNNVIPTSMPTQYVPPLSVPCTPLMPPLETMDTRSSSHAANLVKPSLFRPPVSSSGLVMPPVPLSFPSASPLHPQTTMLRPYGTPLLQPFPPPAPSPHLASTANNAPVISRNGVRGALLRLVQNDQFIDMVYQELLNTH